MTPMCLSPQSVRLLMYVPDGIGPGIGKPLCVPSNLMHHAGEGIGAAIGFVGSLMLALGGLQEGEVSPSANAAARSCCKACL